MILRICSAMMFLFVLLVGAPPGYAQDSPTPAPMLQGAS